MSSASDRKEAEEFKASVSGTSDETVDLSREPSSHRLRYMKIFILMEISSKASTLLLDSWRELGGEGRLRFIEQRRSLVFPQMLPLKFLEQMMHLEWRFLMKLGELKILGTIP